jgi:hypothetical protein
MPNHNYSKRKLLKSIAAGGGAVVAGKSLPESWSAPVIDSVMLPAHASTTQDCGTVTCNPTSLSNVIFPPILYANLTPCVSCGFSGEQQSDSALRITGLDQNPPDHVLIEVLNGFSHEDSLTTTGVGQQPEGKHSIPLKAPDGSIWRFEFGTDSGSLNVFELFISLLFSQ